MSSELKRTLCNELLENDLVTEHDVIRHSYTNNRLLNGVVNMARTESKEKLSPTLDTRCDCLGVVVKEPSELQKEVCNKAMENNLMTPYDIIDYTYSNARLSEIMSGQIKTKNSTDNQIANTITTNAENMGVCVPNLRIRKLTPKETWRLMGFDDEDFHKAAYVKHTYTLEHLFEQGDVYKWSVKSKAAIEKPLLENTETYALNITNALKSMGITSTEWKKFPSEQDSENKQYVNIVITPLGKMARKGCVTNITKCLNSTETLYGLMEELAQHRMAIIEWGNEDKPNTGQYMKISSVENLTPTKLFTILTVLGQIIESKIYTSTLQKVNICGFIANCDDCENDMEMTVISNLKMECMYTRVSSSQLYKQAGNSIVVNVLMAIFKELFVPQKSISNWLDDLLN